MVSSFNEKNKINEALIKSL